MRWEMQRCAVRSRGVFGFGCDTKYVGGGDDGGALLTRDLHGYHVALEELAEVDAGVEARGDQVTAAVVVGGDVEHDLGMVARELGELRTHRHGDREGRGNQADDAGRLLTESADLGERTVDVFQRGPQPREEPLPGIGRRHGACRTREQADTETLLEPADRMADGRRADPEPHRGPREATLVRHRGKGRQHAELVARHC